MMIENVNFIPVFPQMSCWVGRQTFFVHKNSAFPSLCEWGCPLVIPAQRASNAENIPISWRHYGISFYSFVPSEDMAPKSLFRSRRIVKWVALVLAFGVLITCVNIFQLLAAPCDVTRGEDYVEEKTSNDHKTFPMVREPIVRFHGNNVSILHHLRTLLPEASISGRDK